MFYGAVVCAHAAVQRPEGNMFGDLPICSPTQVAEARTPSWHCVEAGDSN